MTMWRAVARAKRCFVHLSGPHNALFTLDAAGTLRAYHLTGGQSLGVGSYQRDRHGQLFTFAPMRIALARGQHRTRIRTPQGDREGLLFEVSRTEVGTDLQTVLAAPDATAIHVAVDGTVHAMRFDVAGALASYPLADPFAPGEPGAWSVLGGRQLRTNTQAALATFDQAQLFTTLTCAAGRQRPGYLFVTSLPAWPNLGEPMLADIHMSEVQPGVWCYRNFHFCFDPDAPERLHVQHTVDARRIDMHGREAEPCWALVRTATSDSEVQRWLSLRRELRRYGGIDASITDFWFPQQTPVASWQGAHVTMFREATRSLDACMRARFTLTDLLAAGIQLLGSLATLHRLGYVHGALTTETIVQLATTSRHYSFALDMLRYAAKLRPAGNAELPGYNPDFTPPEVAAQIARGAREAEVLITPAADAWAVGTILMAHAKRLRQEVRSAGGEALAAQLVDVFTALCARDPQARMTCAEAATTLAFFS